MAFGREVSGFGCNPDPVILSPEKKRKKIELEQEQSQREREAYSRDFKSTENVPLSRTNGAESINMQEKAVQKNEESTKPMTRESVQQKNEQTAENIGQNLTSESQLVSVNMPKSRLRPCDFMQQEEITEKLPSEAGTPEPEKIQEDEETNQTERQESGQSGSHASCKATSEESDDSGASSEHGSYTECILQSSVGPDGVGEIRGKIDVKLWMRSHAQEADQTEELGPEGPFDQTGDDNCEVTSHESDDSSADGEDGSPTARTRPVFCKEWQKSFPMLSATGGTCRLKNSDVELSIPPGAIAVEEADIQVAICTDIELIHNKLHLSDEEQIMSPLAEYKTSHPRLFQKPVSISLPHGLPDDTDLDYVYIYHVSVSEENILQKRKLRVDRPPDAAEYSMIEGPLSRAFLGSNHRVIILTNSFSGYFVCRFCKGNATPNLVAAVVGKFETDTKVSVDVIIWDWRLDSQDFTKQQLGIDLSQCRRWTLQLMDSVKKTELHVLLKMSDRDDNEVTRREKVFSLQHAFVCQKCNKKGRFSLLNVNWCLRADWPDVTLTCEIHHRNSQNLAGAGPSSVCTEFSSVVRTRDPILQTILQRWLEMDRTRQESVARDMGLTAQETNIVNRLALAISQNEPSTIPNDHGAPSRGDHTLGATSSGPPHSDQLPTPIPVQSPFDENVVVNRSQVDPVRSPSQSEVGMADAAARSVMSSSSVSGPPYSDQLPTPIPVQSPLDGNVVVNRSQVDHVRSPSQSEVGMAGAAARSVIPPVNDPSIGHGLQRAITQHRRQGEQRQHTGEGEQEDQGSDSTEASTADEIPTELRLDELKM